jgi:hypothetical protein
VPERQYTDLQAGVDGNGVLPGSGRRRRWRRRRRAAAGNELCAIAERSRATRLSARRCRLRVSADRRKLVYRTAAVAAAAGGGPGGGGARRAPQLFLVDADRNAAAAGQGRLNVALRMYLEPKEEFKQIFNEGWRNQRDYLYVPNMHGADWPKMKRCTAVAAVRECIAPISTTCST